MASSWYHKIWILNFSGFDVPCPANAITAKNLLDFEEVRNLTHYHRHIAFKCSVFKISWHDHISDTQIWVGNLYPQCQDSDIFQPWTLWNLVSNLRWFLLKMTIAKSEATCFQHLTSSANQAKHLGDSYNLQDSRNIHHKQGAMCLWFGSFSMDCTQPHFVISTAAEHFMLHRWSFSLCEVSEQTLLSSQTMTTTWLTPCALPIHSFIQNEKTNLYNSTILYFVITICFYLTFHD